MAFEFDGSYRHLSRLSTSPGRLGVSRTRLRKVAVDPRNPEQQGKTGQSKDDGKRIQNVYTLHW
jgi:hypothetical protein